VVIKKTITSLAEKKKKKEAKKAIPALSFDQEVKKSNTKIAFSLKQMYYRKMKKNFK
jgi:hypothetical protein